MNREGTGQPVQPPSLSYYIIIRHCRINRQTASACAVWSVHSLFVYGRSTTSPKLCLLRRYTVYLVSHWLGVVCLSLTAPEFHYKTCLIKSIENSPPKNWKFSDKKTLIFHIFAQNIDCCYSLEPPHRGDSNEYPQSMFWAEIRKNISEFFIWKFSVFGGEFLLYKSGV